MLPPPILNDEKIIKNGPRTNMTTTAPSVLKMGKMGKTASSHFISSSVLNDLHF